MVEELSNTDQLNQLLESWQTWCESPPLETRELGGNSNSSFLVHCETTSYVVRINSAAEPPGVSRHRENQILRKISGSSFSPEVILIGQHYLVTRYIEPPHEEVIEPGDMASIFRELHLQPLDTGPVLDPVSRLKDYAHLLEPSVRELALDLIEALDPPLCATVLCHNDTNPGNVIAGSDGITLIDWEYACPGPALFDLAVFIESHELDEAAAALLIDNYQAGLNSLSLADYRVAYQLLEKLWWQTMYPEAGFPARLESWAASHR